MTDLTPELATLGAALERAAAGDLAPRRRVRRRFALAAVALAVAVPGAAVAAAHFIGNDSVAQSMPAGALELAGTEPSCTTVTQDVEYHCTLAHPPSHELSDYTGTVYETVDATKHVNGGCRSLNAAGTVWECYIGEAAVQQKIISQDFLGQLQTAPAVG